MVSRSPVPYQSPTSSSGIDQNQILQLIMLKAIQEGSGNRDSQTENKLQDQVTKYAEKGVKYGGNELGSMFLEELGYEGFEGMPGLGDLVLNPRKAITGAGEKLLKDYLNKQYPEMAKELGFESGKGLGDVALNPKDSLMDVGKQYAKDTFKEQFPELAEQFGIGSSKGISLGATNSLSGGASPALQGFMETGKVGADVAAQSMSQMGAKQAAELGMGTIKDSAGNAIGTQMAPSQVGTAANAGTAGTMAAGNVATGLLGGAGAIYGGYEGAQAIEKGDPIGAAMGGMGAGMGGAAAASALGAWGAGGIAGLGASSLSTLAALGPYGVAAAAAMAAGAYGKQQRWGKGAKGLAEKRRDMVRDSTTSGSEAEAGEANNPFYMNAEGKRVFRLSDGTEFDVGDEGNGGKHLQNFGSQALGAAAGNESDNQKYDLKQGDRNSYSVDTSNPFTAETDGRLKTLGRMLLGTGQHGMDAQVSGYLTNAIQSKYDTPEEIAAAGGMEAARKGINDEIKALYGRFGIDSKEKAYDIIAAQKDQGGMSEWEHIARNAGANSIFDEQPAVNPNGEGFIDPTHRAAYDAYRKEQDTNAGKTALQTYITAEGRPVDFKPQDINGVSNMATPQPAPQQPQPMPRPEAGPNGIQTRPLNLPPGATGTEGSQIDPGYGNDDWMEKFKKATPSAPGQHLDRMGFGAPDVDSGYSPRFPLKPKSEGSFWERMDPNATISTADMMKRPDGSFGPSQSTTVAEMLARHGGQGGMVKLPGVNDMVQRYTPPEGTDPGETMARMKEALSGYLQG